MFDGKSLAGWKETPFTSHGQVRVENGTVTLGTGYLTGINWAGSFPKINYEVRVEAARMKGSDFFAGITFPVGDAFCTWINGGWGGEVVGLSSLEENDASENETTSLKIVILSEGEEAQRPRASRRIPAQPARPPLPAHFGTVPLPI